jgi:hypothetical protein
MHKKLLVVLFGTTLLAACSGGEPSEKDIEAALLAQLQQQLSASSDVFKPEDVVVNAIKKVGCVAAEGSAGYQCDVDIDVVVTLPYVGEQHQQGVQSMRFVETETGWAAVE